MSKEFLFLDGVRMHRDTMMEYVRGLEEAYKHSQMDLKGRYMVSMKSKIERGKEILGVEFIPKRTAEEKAKFKSAHHYVSMKNTKKGGEKKKKSKNGNEFKILAAQLHSKGQSALEALKKAAKEHNMTLTKTMLKYPGSYIHSYKKLLKA